MNGHVIFSAGTNNSEICASRYGSSLDDNSNTPLHLAAKYLNSASIVRELAQLHPPAALELKNVSRDTPLHTALKYSTSVEVIRELIALDPATLMTRNQAGATPLAVTIDALGSNTEFHYWKLQVLLEAAPQAGRIPSLNNRRLPLNHILCRRNPHTTPEQVAMVLAVFREAVNIVDDRGCLTIFFAARFASLEAMKIIAEENMSNLSARSSDGRSVVHAAVYRNRLENLQYIHSMMPELLLCIEARYIICSIRT